MTTSSLFMMERDELALSVRSPRYANAVTACAARLAGSGLKVGIFEKLAFWAKCRSLHLAHLLRDTQYAIDAGDASFAPALRRLLLQAIAIGRRRDRLKDTTLKAYAAKLEAKLTQLLEIVPDSPQGEKLQRVIKKARPHLFVFVTQRDLPPTNNGSEQTLRPGVIFRKVTNGFRSIWGANLYADVRSVLETARRRGINRLDAIRQTLKGMILTVETA